MTKTLTWDVFCRVVDNYGDAGVCWRLARELAARHDARVRLWIDDLESLQRLMPAVSSVVDEQEVEGVHVSHWREPLAAAPADIVIEAFGCGVPRDYANAMASCAQPPVWVVLEYLSAEAWVTSHHALPSPHPRLPLTRHYFFPGFTEGTGGLLREADLFDRRDHYDDDAHRRFWRSLGHASTADGATTVSVFAYKSAPLTNLLQCWQEGTSPTVAAIPEGESIETVCKYFDVKQIPETRVLRRGALEVRIVPFVPQARYDELLWACDINFVRGEDSFVRAQWAAHPFVWHIYPQSDEAHAVKLEAFLARYTSGLPDASRAAVTNLMRLWNQTQTGAVTPASAWAAYVRELPLLRQHGVDWAQRIAASGDLAGNLARFCLSKLK